MAIVIRRRRRGLGDLSTDMHNAAMNAPTVTDLPSHAPYLTAYHYAGQTFINLNNPAENGGDDTANWVGYTDAFYGKTEADKTYYWGGQGAEVQIPGWTPEMAVKDPAGYQAALALWRQQNAAKIASVTADIRGTQATEFSSGEAERVHINAVNILQGWLEHRTWMLQHGSTPSEAPKYPPEWYTGPLDAATKAELARLVAGLPPDPVVVQTMTNNPPVPAPSGGSGGGGGTSGGTYTPVNFPTPGGSVGTTNGPSFTSANPDQSMPSVVPSGAAGPGFDASGNTSGGGAAAAGGGLFASPLALAGLAGVAFLLMRKRH